MLYYHLGNKSTRSTRSNSKHGGGRKKINKLPLHVLNYAENNDFNHLEILLENHDIR